MTMEEIKEQLAWVKAELKRLEMELARVDGVVMDLREEVHSLVAQVRRGNALNVETQKEVMELRREAQTGFDGVHDSLTAIITHLKVNNANVPQATTDTPEA